MTTPNNGGAVFPVRDAALDAAAVEAGYVSWRSMQQCTNAWLAVNNLLHELVPDWSNNSLTGREAALETIRHLAARRLATPVGVEQWKIDKHDRMHAWAVEKGYDGIASALEATPAAAPRVEGYITPSGERCRCDCHRNPNVKHIAPCCYPAATPAASEDGLQARLLFIADEIDPHKDLAQRDFYAIAGELRRLAASGQRVEGMVLVEKDLLREAADNAEASTVEDGISDLRREYRNGLATRLRAVLATPNPVRAEQPEGKGEDALIALFNEVYEREWDRAADEADDRAKAIMGPADEHATRMAIRAVLAAAPAAPVGDDARCGSERYELDAYIWKRESTQEWVLEISGEVGGASFISRHSEPLTTPPEDVAGLPSLYAALSGVSAPVGVDESDIRWLLDEVRHGPLDHDYIKDEKRCGRCKRLAKITAALAGKEGA